MQNKKQILKNQHNYHLNNYRKDYKQNNKREVDNLKKFSINFKKINQKIILQLFFLIINKLNTFLKIFTRDSKNK